MRNVPGKLKSVSFLKTIPRLHRVETGNKISVFLFRSDVFCFRIEQVFVIGSLLHQFFMIAGFAKLFCHLCHGIRTVSIFERVRSAKIENPAIRQYRVFVWNVPVFYEIVQVVFSISQVSSMIFHFVFQRCLVTFVHLKIADSAVVSRCNQQSLEIGLHTVGINSGSLAIVQPAAIFVIIDIRLNVLFKIIGIRQCPQLAQIPETAPDTVGIEMPVSWLPAFIQRNLPDTTINKRILSVYIARNSTPKQRMVQTSVKLNFINTVSVFHIYTAQFFVPGLCCKLVYLVKSFVCGFGFKVQPCIFD